MSPCVTVRAARVWAVALGLAAIPGGAARAHPGPAEPPEFLRDACIVRVDKGETPSFHLTYAVPNEDAEPDPDLLTLSDTQTHQFFALAASLAHQGNDQVVAPFGGSSVRPMPRWIDAGDIARAGEAPNREDIPWTPEAVDPADVLEDDVELAERAFAFTSEPARLPILEASGMAGVDWDLTDVPPGPYQIVAYIFSPPYNGWVPRPGLVKIVDAAHDPPALTVSSVASRLFAGHGRRVTGCVDAPEGSTLRVSTRAQGDDAAAFETRVQGVPLGDDGTYEACLVNPGEDGIVEVRVEVETPEGDIAATLAHEVISWFSGAAPCTDSAILCCDEAVAPPTPDAGAPDQDAAPTDAGATADAGQSDDASVPTHEDAGVAEDAAAPPVSDAGPPPAEATSSGCQARPDAGPPSGALLLCVAWLSTRLRRRWAARG